MLNTVQLMGRFTADPELFSGENYTVCKFSLAVSRNYKDENGDYPTDFLNLVAWGKLAEFITTHFQKGQLAVVDGRIHTRGYTDKNGNNRIATEIAAEHIYFTGKTNFDGDPEQTAEAEQSADTSSSLASSERYSELVDELNNMDTSDEPYPFY